MQNIEELIRELNIPAEKLQELAQRMSANPMAAMSMVQELQIPPETFQKIIAAVMANPMAILDLAKKFGVDQGQIKSVEDQLSKIQQPPQTSSEPEDH